MKIKTLPVEIKEINEEEGTLRAVFSSGTKDRHGEIIDQSSWKLDEFMKNPVVLFAHQDKEPAIGQVIELGLNINGMLEGVIKFAIKEYDFARTLFNLYKGKFMRAFSVGFMPGREEETDDGIVFKDNVLYELSAVNIPADALALAKSKGMDLSWVEKKKEKSPACRMDGETKDDCIKRKIPEIMKENPKMTQDEAIAIAESLCDKKCEDKKNMTDTPKTKEGRVLSSKNRAIIEKAKSALEDVLQADKGKEEDRKNAKYQQTKKINQAIRLLLNAKRKNR